MRTTQTARYARWSAAVALLLATAVSGVYGRRAWQAHLARLSMRPSVPSSVQQQTAGLALSKVTGDRTEYTVRASHATEFTEGGRSVLQDVWVTAYGEDGERFDNLHTRACDYLEPTGDIACGGPVQIDLQSAEDARLHPSLTDPKAQVVHIDTTGVSFNHKTGQATTDQPLTFSFPQGEGRAIGFRYDAGKGELNLVSAVEMTLHGAMTPSNPAALLHVSSSSLTYYRDRRVIHFIGPVEAHMRGSTLAAGVVDVELDASMHAQRVVATGHPVCRDTTRDEPVAVSADELSALVLPDGSVEKMIAAGNVHAESRGLSGWDDLWADHAELEMNGHTNWPQRLTAVGSVTAAATRPGGLRQNLTSSTLQVDFAADGGRDGGVQIARAATPSGALDWERPEQGAGGAAIQRVHMTSQHWQAIFGGQNQLDELRGNGGTQIEWRAGSEPPQTGSSQDLVAHFGPTGEWSTIDQTGRVILREPERSARADAAHYDRLADTVALSGSVELSDSASTTTARAATLRRATNEFHAEGQVATIEDASAARATDFAPGPARISAERLDADTATGHATYSGKARLWQGDSVVEGDTIELDRTTHLLTANGRVRAIFPEAETASLTNASSSRSSASTAVFWQAEAGRMTYASQEGRGHLEKNVFAHSGRGSMHADAMDLFFTPSQSAAGTGRQLTVATGFGNVEVDQEDRRGTSSRADYTAADGKFILSGGSPSVHDSSGNSVTGHELTLFYADDTIMIDSAEGLRTLTLHPVGK